MNNFHPSQLPRRSRKQSEDIEPISASDPHPFYPPGDYTAQCIDSCSYRDPRFRTWKIRLDFKILDREEWKEPVCKFFNLGNKEVPIVSLGSHYRRAWIRANGNQPPKRNDRASHRIFRGKKYLVRVGTNTVRWESVNGVRLEHSEGEQYSTVKELIEPLD